MEIRNRNGQTARELAEAADSPVWELLIPSRNQGTSQNANGIEALRSKFRDKALLPRTIEKVRSTKHSLTIVELILPNVLNWLN